MGDARHNAICAALNMLTPKRALGSRKVRVGDARDGGYVMIDQLEPSGGRAYSIGVGPDTSWDVDMAGRGWTVLQYDHTVDGAPHPHERCVFHKIGLAPDDDDPELKRLDTLLAMNGDAETDHHMLKIDIEGNEWACLAELDPGFFGRFDQIVAELHWLDHLKDSIFRSVFRRVISNIGKTHTCVHVHANNFADFVVESGIPIPPVLEVTFVLSSKFDFDVNTEAFPGILDNANNSARPDIYLGAFHFPLTQLG